MKRPGLWLVFVLAMSFLLYSLVSPLSAQTFKLVFTKQYMRPPGEPVIQADPFTVCDPRGTFRLVVLNGPDGLRRVTSGEIFVNETRVVRERDFNQNVARIERPLTNILQDNRLGVRLKGNRDAAIRVTVEGIQRCLGIKITSPTPGSVITRSSVLVRGEVTAPAGTEVGVTVNGVVAEVSQGKFGAFVPLELGGDTLTATVVDAAGNSTNDSVTVQVPSRQEDPLRLLASPSRGLNPLTVQLDASNLLGRRIVRFDLDFEGDGVVDLSSATFAGVAHTYSSEGLFFPTLTVTDDTGTRTSATAIVNVFALPDLVAKWNAMKDALRRGDIAGALRFIAEESRDRYRNLFTALAADLPQIDAILTDIRLVRVERTTAEFEMLRTESDGVERSFYILFIRDSDGLWRLRTF